MDKKYDLLKSKGSKTTGEITTKNLQINKRKEEETREKSRKGGEEEGGGRGEGIGRKEEGHDESLCSCSIPGKVSQG